MLASLMALSSHSGEIIAGPADPTNATNVAEWLAAQKAYRTATLKQYKLVRRAVCIGYQLFVNFLSLVNNTSLSALVKMSPCMDITLFFTNDLNQ